MVIELVYDLDQWQWGSRTKYPDGTKRPFKMDKVVIHWGGYTNPGTGQEDEMAILRGWQRYHIDSKGWTDIAYNFAVGNSGLSYRLRGINRSGATSGDYENDGIPENNEALPIVWLGGKNHEISDAAYATMSRLIRESQQTVVIGHRGVKGTTQCPGDDWMTYIGEERWTIVAPPPPPPPPPTGDHQMITIKHYAGYESKGLKHQRPTVVAGQRMLAYHGFADQKTVDSTCASDGWYGPGTVEATKDYQQARGLVIDGTIGPVTWASLENG